MKSFALIAGASAALVSAQEPTESYSYSAVPTLIPGQENTWQCPESNMNYCMPGAQIIICNGTALGVGHNCNDEVDQFEDGMENAFCYQPTSGMANCAVSGTVYGSATTYAIPSTTSAPSTTPAPSGPPMPSTISGAGNAYSCPMPNANYCPDGVGANIIIWCNSTGLGEAHNCNDVLDEYENPYGENAYCYDATPGDGMAACALSGYAFASTATYAVPIPSMYQSLQSLSAPSGFPYPMSSSGLSTDCSTPTAPVSSTSMPTAPGSSTSMQSMPTSPPSSTSVQIISTPPASTSVLQGQGASNTHYAAAGLVAAVGLLGLAL